MRLFSAKRAFFIDAYNAGVAKWILQELCGSNYQIRITDTALCRPVDYDTETQECESLKQLHYGR